MAGTSLASLLWVSVQATLPVFIIIGATALLVSKGHFDDHSVRTINFMVKGILAPSLLFVRLGEGVSVALMQEAWVLVVAGAVTMAFNLVAARVVLVPLSKPESRFLPWFLLGQTFQNVVALPLVFVQSLCLSMDIRKPGSWTVVEGEEFLTSGECLELGEVYIFVYIIVPNIFMFMSAFYLRSLMDRDPHVATLAAEPAREPQQAPQLLVLDEGLGAQAPKPPPAPARQQPAQDEGLVDEAPKLPVQQEEEEEEEERKKEDGLVDGAPKPPVQVGASGNDNEMPQLPVQDEGLVNLAIEQEPSSSVDMDVDVDADAEVVDAGAAVEATPLSFYRKDSVSTGSDTTGSDATGSDATGSEAMAPSTTKPSAASPPSRGPGLVAAASGDEALAGWAAPAPAPAPAPSAPPGLAHIVLATVLQPPVLAQLVGMFVGLVGPIREYLFESDNFMSPLVTVPRILAPGLVPVVNLGVAVILGLKMCKTPRHRLFGGADVGMSRRTLAGFVLGRMVIVPGMGFALLYLVLPALPDDDLMKIIIGLQLATPTANLVAIVAPPKAAAIMSLGMLHQFIIGAFTLSLWCSLLLVMIE